MKQVWVNHNLKIRIPQDVDAVLEDVARSNQMTKQEVIRYIVEHEKTFWEFSNQTEEMRYLLSKYLDPAGECDQREPTS